MSYFAVSRGSLRETLRVLSYLGAIDVRSGPGGGARIALPGPRVVGSAIAIGLQFRGATVRGLMEARTVLEPAAARIAAQNADAADVAALRACADALAERADPAVLDDRRLEFHRLLAASTGNDVLELVLTALAWMCGVARPARGEAAVRAVADERRQALVEAIEARDVTAAATHATAVVDAIVASWSYDGGPLDERVLWPDIDELPDAGTDVTGHGWTRPA